MSGKIYSISFTCIEKTFLEFCRFPQHVAVFETGNKTCGRYLGQVLRQSFAAGY